MLDMDAVIGPANARIRESADMELFGDSAHRSAFRVDTEDSQPHYHMSAK